MLSTYFERSHSVMWIWSLKSYDKWSKNILEIGHKMSEICISISKCLIEIKGKNPDR